MIVPRDGGDQCDDGRRGQRQRDRRGQRPGDRPQREPGDPRPPRHDGHSPVEPDSDVRGDAGREDSARCCAGQLSGHGPARVPRIHT